MRSFKDPLSRLIAESVIIDKEYKLNSKSEWRNNKMSQLVVEAPTGLSKKREEIKKTCELNIDDDMSDKIESFRIMKEKAPMEGK